MQRRIVVALAILAISASGMAGCKKNEPEKTTEAPATAPAPAAPSQPGAATTAGAQSGEALYKQYCVACHPDGGNTINPKKTLHKADMAASNIKSADDVVKVMRNPGPGMNKFDTSMISDQDAKAIGEYVMTTFNK